MKLSRNHCNLQVTSPMSYGRIMKTRLSSCATRHQFSYCSCWTCRLTGLFPASRYKQLNIRGRCLSACGAETIFKFHDESEIPLAVTITKRKKMRTRTSSSSSISSQLSRHHSQWVTEWNRRHLLAQKRISRSTDIVVSVRLTNYRRPLTLQGWSEIPHIPLRRAIVTLFCSKPASFIHLHLSTDAFPFHRNFFERVT